LLYAKVCVLPGQEHNLIETLAQVPKLSLENAIIHQQTIWHTPDWHLWKSRSDGSSSSSSRRGISSIRSSRCPTGRESYLCTYSKIVAVQRFACCTIENREMPRRKLHVFFAQRNGDVDVVFVVVVTKLLSGGSSKSAKWGSVWHAVAGVATATAAGGSF
jgi:hypothetical protein